MGNYQLLVDAHIFDTDVILDALTRLTSVVEGKRYYLRQKETLLDTDGAKERNVYYKTIRWQDKDGKVLSEYVLGKYSVYWSRHTFHEQTMFLPNLRKSIADDAWVIFQVNQIVSERLKKTEAILECKHEFDLQPYILEFVQFLVNYRIANNLSEITEEQMDEALDLYIAKCKEQGKQKVLQPNKPQD